MPHDGPYERYPVSGSEIRETTEFGRVSLAGLGDVFEEFTTRHQASLAEVEGDVVARLALGPGQAESQRRRLERQAVFGMSGAELFADEVDSYNGQVETINSSLDAEEFAWGTRSYTGARPTCRHGG